MDWPAEVILNLLFNELQQLIQFSSLLRWNLTETNCKLKWPDQQRLSRSQADCIKDMTCYLLKVQCVRIGHLLNSYSKSTHILLTEVKVWMFQTKCLNIAPLTLWWKIVEYFTWLFITFWDNHCGNLGVMSKKCQKFYLVITTHVPWNCGPIKWSVIPIAHSTIEYIFITCWCDIQFITTWIVDWCHDLMWSSHHNKDKKTTLTQIWKA